MPPPVATATAAIHYSPRSDRRQRGDKACEGSRTVAVKLTGVGMRANRREYFFVTTFGKPVQMLELQDSSESNH
jgi:hypothetical protein